VRRCVSLESGLVLMFVYVCCWLVGVYLRLLPACVPYIWGKCCDVRGGNEIVKLHRIQQQVSGRAVQGRNCLHLLESWNRVLESHPRHGCLCAYILCFCCPVCR
jgi:hypothetical protein